MADGNFRFKVNGFDSYKLLLGEELRGERATLGKSLLQVQKDLRIKAAYISAIENCDLDAFPNKGFVAGYVRSYARYLNLNAEEVYERFCLESGFSARDRYSRIPINNTDKRVVSKDYKIGSNLDWKPSTVGFQNTNSVIKSRQYLFMGPVLLVGVILFGLCLGAWKVLIDIQKLKIIPAENLPIIMSEMNLEATDISVKSSDNSFGMINIAPHVNNNITQSLESLPNVIYRDGPIARLGIEDVGVLGMNSININKTQPFVGGTISQLPQKDTFAYGIFPEFDSSVSIVGNIKKEPNKLFVDPNVKKFVSPKDILVKENSETSEFEKNNANGGFIQANENNTTLNIFAVNPSWIRIKDKGRNIVVEKILKSGEVLEIKKNWFSGDLRAGNAKDLFFSLNGVTYGPVSDKTRVIKNFKIDPQNIFNSLKINDLRESYLNSFLDRKRSL
ncbi:DUF4115 domain-containing protein [Paracoccaceae bacterium]|nr:DUF4115 domain-containing protein [Paracoccaceae bacterium]